MAALDRGAAAGKLRVWDPWVRLTHWAIALLLPISWWTAETGRFDLHFLSGYAILTLVLFRLAWGIVGSDTARFARFLKGPAAALAHLAHLRHREVPAEVGHNPAGGWAVVALLGLLLAQAASGLFADDLILNRGPLARRVDEAWATLATSVHLRVFWAIVALAVVHVLAVIAYRVVAGRNLVRPMLTGRMQAPPGTPAPRMGSNLRAAVLLGAAAGLVWWISTLRPPGFF
jgi:cytochrome b